MIAIIGGTGVGRFPLDDSPVPATIETPYGVAATETGTLHGKEIVFLARHGAGHRVPPHRINYRANIAALRQIGARAVLATTAVGGLNTRLKTGDLVLLDDLIDFTRDRSGKTFFDGEGGTPVVHTDFTFPYSPALRETVLVAATALGIPLHQTGTYLCSDGPRYETPAEVRLFVQWGADVVGMTGVPEATLAREAGLHYAGISLVTNLAAGLSPQPLTHAEVEAAMAQAGPLLRTLLIETVDRLNEATLPPTGPDVPLPLPLPP